MMATLSDSKDNETDQDSSESSQLGDHDYISPGDESEVENDTTEYVSADETEQPNPVVHPGCLCEDVKTADDLDSVLARACDLDFNINNFYCIYDNIIRCFNYVASNTDTPLCVNRLMMTDYFYRVRHELLFKSVCKAYNLPITKSDSSFAEFGISSSRTPDLIIRSTEGSLLIIEITAVSNYDKAAQSKGVESAGFESKYEKEITELNTKGENVIYVPIVFEMNNTVKSIEPMLAPLQEIFNLNITGKALLRLVYSSMSILTMNTKDYNVLPAAILFSNLIDIKRDHDRVKFIYEEEKPPISVPVYTEYRVSNPVYRRISTIWNRLPNIMDYNELDQRLKYEPVLNISDNRLYFNDSSTGVTPIEIKRMVHLNDKPGFFAILKLDTGNKKIKASESSTGYKYMDRVNKKVSTVGYTELREISMVNGHVCLPPSNKANEIDKSVYRKKLNTYNSHYYPNVQLNLDYENEYFRKISSMDDRILSNVDIKQASYTPTVTFKPLAFRDLTQENMEAAFSDYKDNLIKENSFTDCLPLKKNKVKQPFLMPLAEINSYNYVDLSSKNYYFLEELATCLDSNNMFTAEVIRKVKNDNYKFHTPKQLPSQELTNLISDRRRISNEITKYHRCKARKLDRSIRMKYSPKGEPEYDALRNQLSQVDRTIQQLKKKEGILEDIAMVRLPSKNRKTEVGSWFNKEMAHFKNKSVQSTIEGVGLGDNPEASFRASKLVVESLMQKLPCYSGENPDMVIVNTGMAEDIPLLKGLKQEAFNQYGPLIEDIKNSYLGHAAALVSRFCHSLLFYSQMSFNSERLRVDTLGYDNVLLIVRGGNKIFKSKCSKLFRLVYPISSELKQWYVGPNSSFICEDILGVTYVITPWQLMHESVLTDGLSFYNRIVSFNVLNSKPGVLFKDQFQRLALNTLLAFHNRRQSEVFLANLRYVLLSCLGDFSGMSDIFNDFVGFNYDFFQLYLRCSFMYNFPTYFRTLREMMDNKQLRSLTVKDLIFGRGILKNIFTDTPISDTDDMALMIYSTFLMTKAPYKRNVERANNLKGILKIHQEYEEVVGLNLNSRDQFNHLSVDIRDFNTFEDYANKLFENDFKIDPSYIANLGVFADSLLSKKGGADQINLEWIKIMSESWDSMATSTGLRGDLEEVEDFWGKKGYFVVYKDLIKRPDFQNEVRSLFNDPITDDEKRKKLRKLNNTYLDQIDKPTNFWVFHAVDKTQWRGGREIYVMDIHTKQHQQPIEKFMGYLCKLLDNELISIPSDKRTQVIHHSIFEKDLELENSLTWYLTLDCSKWAPKSIFIKFVIMVLNMHSIPSSFKTHFLNYIDKLYEKRIYFNNSEVEVLLNNPFYKDKIDKYLVKDDSVNGYYMIMPYSWVMGIFNYTSSFMHAVNQEYASYIITKSSIENTLEETSLVMYAHSDDSGGRMTSVTRSMIQRGLFIYEVNLKCCNHLLSKKKSVVSRFYFEILSIIYLFKSLLALLPKFLGGIRFLPTDKGPAQDMSQAYSKCIEVMVAGADFSVAHIVMCFYSALVWRFYYNRNPIPNDFRRPVQYFGIPAAHPLMVLITGSDSDIVRLIASGDSRMLKGMAGLNKFLSTNIEDGSILPSPTFLIKVRGIQKGFEDSLSTFKDQINEWSIKYVNFKSTPFNFLNFLSKLSDPGFVGSLVNESTVRRLSRAFFLRSGNSVNTSIGTFTLKDLLSSIEVLQTVIDDVSPVNYEDIFPGLKSDMVSEIDELDATTDCQMTIIKSILSGPLQICKYMAQIDYKPENFKAAHKTLKPTHLQITKTSGGFSSNFDPAVLVSYITQPEFRWALPDVRNLSFVHEELIGICDQLGINLDNVHPNFLLQLCRFYSNKQVKNIYLYSRVPSDLRHIKTYSSFLTFLAVNSFEGKELLGLTLKLDREIVGVDYLEKEIDEYVYISATVLSIITSILKSNDRGYYTNISINNIEEMNWAGGTLIELCDEIISRCSHDYTNKLIILQASYIRERVVYGHCSAGILKHSYFYCFLKSQRQGSSWYGNGEILIYCDENYFIFKFKDRVLLSLETNVIGKIDHLDKSFILEIFRINDIDYGHKSMLHSDKIDTIYMFGFDWSGDLSILQRREMKVGVPVKQTLGFSGFMSNLSVYNLVHESKNKYILQSGEEQGLKHHKIYTINTTQSFIIPLVEKMFKVEEFEEVMMNKGFGSIGEFIYNEVLLNYGIESYVSLDEFIDGFSGSRIFEIMKDAKMKKYGVFPRTISTTVYPAPRGGLLRLLYEYTEENPNNKIVKILKNVNQDFMRVRSLYPEQFTAVFSEVLTENYLKLYSPAERQEVMSVYKEICKITDIEELKSTLIKVMSYWGYNSLCGMIAIYNFSKNAENYRAVRWQNNDHYNSYYSSLFVKLHKSMCQAMLKFEDVLQTVDLPITSFKPPGSLHDFFDSMNMRISLSCYGYKYPAQLRSIDTITFFNLLHALLTDDEFTDCLNDLTKNEPLLSTLPIDHKHRSFITPLYNNLKVFWCISHRSNFILDFNKRQQRLPHDLIDPTTLYKEISLDPKPAKNKYHHGQLCRFDLKYMQRDFSARIGNKLFKVKNILSDLSKERVVIHPQFKYARNLNLEALQDSPDWDDFNFELDTVDPDIDSMKEYIENIKSEMNMYQKSITFSDSSGGLETIYTRFNWLTIFGKENDGSFISYLRQVGENIVLITDAYLPALKNYFIKVSARIMNFKQMEGNEGSCKNQVCLAYALYSDSRFSEDFIDRLLSPNRIAVDKSLEDVLCSNTYFNTKGEIGAIWSGVDETLNLMLDERSAEIKEENKRKELEAEEQELQKKKEMAKVNGGLHEILDGAVKDKKISIETAKKLNNKYTAALNVPVDLSLESVLDDLMTEINLNELKSLAPDLLKGNITPEENLNIMQMPKHFGLAFEQNKIDRKMFSDKRVQVELASLHEDLPKYIGSATLSISKKLAPVVFSNFNLWRTAVKGTKFKKQNKEFLLNLLNMVVNDSCLTGDRSDGGPNKHDNFWRELIENCTVYFGNEGEDFNAEELNSFFGVGQTSRLIYNPVHYYPRK